MKSHFEVRKVHFPDDETAEACDDQECEETHVWSVYIREGKLADWVSDHLTDELALACVPVYETIMCKH